MDRIEKERALFLGVCALQDYADRARKDPLEATLQLRALLALLASHGGGPKPYRDFWETARQPLNPANPYRQMQDYERGTMTQTQWIRIARELGFPAVSSDFCERVQKVVKQAQAARSAATHLRKPDCGWL